MVCSTVCSKAVAPVLGLLFVALWFILRGYLFYVLQYYFVIVFSILYAMRLPHLGEERANLSAFRMFILFALVWFCMFPLPLGVWEELFFFCFFVFFFFCFFFWGGGVVFVLLLLLLLFVALPGLFSYLF